MAADSTARPSALRAAVVLLALALWLLLTLGLRPLLMPDEGRYGDVARQMLAGDAWIPRLDGLPFFHKPPLFYWVDALAMRLLGVNAATARAGAMLGAWLMGASLYLHARARWGERTAAIALGLLATTPLYFVSAQYANHDMLVAACISAAVLAFLQALESRPRPALGWVVAAWVACAAGVLAKGLIGLVLPALVLGPWLLITGRWRTIPALMHPLAVLAGLAVAAPWFVAVQSRFPGFFDYFIMEQHVRRFAASGFNNVQPWWFFLLLLPLLTLPWSLWLPALARRERPTGPWVWWVLAILIFFSVPQSKLVGYVLPALPAWALLLAFALQSMTDRRLKILMALAASACLAVVVGLAWRSPAQSRAIGEMLGERMDRADRLVMVDAPLHDVAYHAGLTQAPVILSDWSGAKARVVDGWRKELSDAARFDPAAGQRILRPLSDNPGLPCGNAALWFLVPDAQRGWIARRPSAQQVHAWPGLSLWREPMMPCGPAGTGP